MTWLGVYDLSSSDFAKDQDPSEDKPTIVLVHDAFHSPTHLERLAKELREFDLTVLMPQLPSSTATCQSGIFEADIQALWAYCKPKIDSGRDLIFVLHGYAGLPGPVAAERLNSYSLNRPRAGFVAKIVFVAALVAEEGESAFDIFQPDWIGFENGSLKAFRPDQVFFHDCAPDDVRTAVSMIGRQLANSFDFHVLTPGWPGIPCVYIVCGSSRAVPSSCQQICSQKLQVRNNQTAVISLQCGHSPWLSRTAEMAALIVRLSTAN